MPNAARYGTDRWRFQDSNPFHLLSTDSVDAINKAVSDRSYTYDNFRPNIVVKTLNELPWDEVGKYRESHIRLRIEDLKLFLRIIGQDSYA